MKSAASAPCESTLARPLAPEDVRCGDYLAVLNETVECPSFLWCGLGENVSPEELIRIQIKPEHAGMPFRVQAICLPFVALLAPNEQIQVMDLRRVQLVRLSTDYAKTVWKARKKQARNPIG